MSKKDVAVRIFVDGRPHTLRPSEVTALDAQALRRATGMSLASVLRAAQDDPDIDIVAALVWLARRAKEPGLSFETVAREIGYDSEISSDADTPSADSAAVAADEDAFPEA